MPQWYFTYAKMFGVVAAVIILGSWLVQNTALEQAKSLRDTLVRAESEKTAMDTQLRLENRLLGIYQIVSGNTYRAKVPIKDELNEYIEQLQRVDVTIDFGLAFQRYALRNQKLADTMPINKKIATGMADAANNLGTVLKEFEKSRTDLEKQVKLVGDVIDRNEISAEKEESLQRRLDLYLEQVDFLLKPRLMLAAKDVLRASNDLLDAARSALQVRQKRVEWLRTLQLSLYIVGSLLALFGSFLQAKSRGASSHRAS